MYLNFVILTPTRHLAKGRVLRSLAEPGCAAPVFSAETYCRCAVYSTEIKIF